MIEKLVSREEPDVRVYEVWWTNDNNEREVLETSTVDTGEMLIRKPSQEDIIAKINEIIDVLNALQK